MLSNDQLGKFASDGYLVLENFMSLEKCQALRNECSRVMSSPDFTNEFDKIPIFSTKDDESKAADMYFLTSTDKIRPFKEANLNKNDEKENKQCFNKIGHALHALNPVFKEATFDNNVKDVYKSLGYVKPIVCQSMYIFKQPYVGGEVSIHQDASYLHVEPIKLAGIWIALEDATIENGCLYFIPGSHKGPLTRRFIRNPNKEEFDAGKHLIYTSEMPATDEKDFVAVPVKAGTAILIDALVIHKSEKNLSGKSRHVYAFHVYESDKTTFSPENWMEYNKTSFLPLYDSHNVM